MLTTLLLLALAANPTVQCVGTNAGRQDARGLLSYQGEASAVPGLFSGWSLSHANLSDAGVTTNPVLGAVGSCPYPDPMGGASAVKVDFPAIEDLGTTPSGNSVLYKTYTSTTAPWVHDVFVRACDASDGGTLYQANQWTAAASGKMDAGADWTRAPWTLTPGGTTAGIYFGPTTTAAFGQPASQPALCACLWAPTARLGSVSGPPIMCSSAPCSTATDQNLIVSTAGYPTTSGRVRLTYTPMHTVGQARCLFDTIASNNGVRLCTAADNTLVLTLGDGSATGTTTSAALTWTGGTAYVLEFDWGGGTAFVRKDGVLVASTTSAAKIPTAHAANAGVGQVIGGTSSANGWVKVLSVGRR